MLILVSVILFFIPDKTISKYLGNNNKLIGMIFAVFGDYIILIHGFIVFPAEVTDSEKN